MDQTRMYLVRDGSVKGHNHFYCPQLCQVEPVRYLQQEYCPTLSDSDTNREPERILRVQHSLEGFETRVVCSVV